MNLNKQKLFISSICFALIVCSILMPNISNASSVTNEIFDSTCTNSNITQIIGGATTMNNNENLIQIEDLDGKEFFIKNAATGQYLDVSGGVIANGTNVQQWKYNGTDSQRWYVKYNHDQANTFSIYSRLSNSNKYEYSLDISEASTENCANVQIYSINGTNAQKFQLACTDNSAIAILTAVTNSQKAVVLNGPTCDEGRNVDQYTYQGHINEEWIFEPIERNTNLGVYYARKNSRRFVYTYPDLTKMKGDCANFTSQCILASGTQHYTDKWKIYRKNFNITQPTNVPELDGTWELCPPQTSPWTSAVEFRNYWKNKVSCEAFTVDYILSHINEIYSKPYTKCDVVQVAENNFNVTGKAAHTMFITNYNNSSADNQTFYALSGHSNPICDENLLNICRKYQQNGKNHFIVFYRM